jgi:phage virion morphogenesis protein
MAGARITIDDAAARRAFAGFAELGRNPRALLVDIGADQLLRTRERAERQESPDGIPWAPLSPRYATRKKAKRPGARILVYDNLMLGALLSYQVDAGAVEVGTNALWGATHQFGADERGIPARAYLGLGDDDAQAVLDIVAEHINRPLR